MFKKRISQIKPLLLVASLATIPNYGAYASEGATNYAAGSAGVLFGELPKIPGLFAISHTAYTTADAVYDNDGDKIDAVDFDLEVWSETVRILGSYDTSVLGGRLYSQLVVPIVSMDSSLGVNGHAVYDESETGLGPITISPIILYWNKENSNHHFTMGLDITPEQLTSYDENKPVNTATGYTSYIPGGAYRYENPNGLDIGIKANFLFNAKNDHTNYDSGDLVILDLLAAWNINQHWKTAFVGGYVNQYGNDKDNGVTVANGNKMEFLGLGPSISYKSGPFNIELNYQKGLLAKNTSMNDAMWLNLTLPLYIPSKYLP